MIDICTNLALIHDEIQSLIAQNPKLSTPTLISVSKRQPLASVESLAAVGQRDFAENYLQEAVTKIRSVKGDHRLTWHFIGAIQSNKTRAIAENFDWVHTVDRLKIAQRLSEQRPENTEPLNLCLQVNIDKDPAKAGVLPENCVDLALQVAALSNIKIRGLMTITAADTDTPTRRASFKRMRVLYEEVKEVLALESFDSLSMGMSADWRLAVEEGANMIRVGTAIFGSRQ